MNLNQIWNPITPPYFTFLGIDMTIYDVHLCVGKCQTQDQILLNIMVVTMEVTIFIKSHKVLAETLKQKGDEHQKFSSTGKVSYTISLFLMVLWSTGRGTRRCLPICGKQFA
jgi:hypothetical protein